jgi:hypothetical protein
VREARWHVSLAAEPQPGEAESDGGEGER